MRTILALLLLTSQALAAGATDSLVRAPLPVIFPKAGGKFIDPSFGTTLVRVTDASSGKRCVHAYSYWRALNSNSTRLLLACDDQPQLYKFDPETGAVSFWKNINDIQFEGASWSTSLPSTLYSLDKAGKKLLRINVETNTIVVVHDFTNEFGTSRSLRQLTMSDGAGVFGFNIIGTGKATEAGVYTKADNQVRTYLREPYQLVNEIQISKGGTRAIIHLEDGGAVHWNLTNNTTMLLPNPTGHWDMGARFYVNGDGILTGVQVRTSSLSSLLGPINVFRYINKDGRTPNWTIAEHVSIRSDDETWLVLSTYAGGLIDQPFEDEIILVMTDGSGFKRLAHTRSCECQTNKTLKYYSQPRAAGSQDGRWITFTSDLGDSGRFDVLMLKVP